MGQALYRKYRPQSLEEIAGQQHITSTLNNALKSGKVSHAYLFTGPKGVGKTSVARILAFEVNKLKYDPAGNHLDIIEIDAASNRRIDEIRDLREKVHILPTSAKYKIYIIDEVHMLTKEAFNALLKTLEEPPEHVIFILATTEAHKLPETIVSRTQRFGFKPISVQDIVKQLSFIAKKEDISVNDEALELLAQHGEGSFRDSISLLDQASSNDKKVTVESVRQLLGIAPQETILLLLKSLSAGEPNEVLTQLDKLYEQGYQAPQIAKQLIAELRRNLIEGNSEVNDLKLTRQLLEVYSSPYPKQLLELILLEHGSTQLSGGPAKITPRPVAEEQSKKPVARTDPDTASLKAHSSQNSSNFDLKLWPKVLADIRKHHNTLYGILLGVAPHLGENGELELVFAYSFHQKRAAEAKNLDIIKNTVLEQTGKPVKIVFTTAQKSSSSVKQGEASTDDSPQSISNIFGPVELLE